MPQDAPPVPSTRSAALELGGVDEVDPELLSLPTPPRRDRTLTLVVLAVACALSLAMALELRRDVAYSFVGDHPVDAGDLHAATPAALAALDNHYVRAEGLLGAAGGIRYERPLVDDSFRTLPVAGRPDLWVDLRVAAGQENGRWEPPRTFAGRLVRLDAAGPRHRGLASALAGASGEAVPAGAWLLVDGESPGTAKWTLVLALTFLGCAAWNAFAALRLVRKVR